MKKPIMLVILDGFGYRSERNGNAIANASMPFWTSLCQTYPSTLLHASGTDVGLLPGYMGNSEVGHLTIGSGRIVDSILKRFHDAIDDGSFFNHEVLSHHFMRLKQSGRALHLMGLVSDGGVHSHNAHLKALIEYAHRCGLTKVFIHAFLDGRDSPPQSAATYLEDIGRFCTSIGCGQIASIQGRFYAMDRDKNWERTGASYTMLCGQTPPLPQPNTWRTILEQSYANALTDEFIIPTLLDRQGAIAGDDGVVFFNFRPDRARQLAEAFINPNFEHFAHPLNTGKQTLAFFISTTRYDNRFTAFNNDILFARENIEHTLLDEIALHIRPQPDVFMIAETEKYAHVTYFFRGMRDIHLAHETQALIPSIKAKSYASSPCMSAPLITQTLLQSLSTNPAFFYVVNYANADMVGHSGDFNATIKACQTLDRQLSCLYQEVVEHANGTLVITADHGNAEEKIDTQGQMLTAHTCNPVPFVIVSKAAHRKSTISAAFSREPVFGLAHIAPTILTLMGLTIPSCMEQETIVVE